MSIFIYLVYWVNEAMAKKIISIIGSTIFLLSCALSYAHADSAPAAGESVPGFPCTKVGQTSVYADRTGVKKITCKKFGKNVLLWDFGVPAYPVPTTEVADAQQKATVIVSSSPKPTPANIPGTSFKWPIPSGDLNKYSGIPREGHAEDLLGLKELHEAGITGKGYSLAFIDSTIVNDNPAFEKTDMVCVGAVDPLLTFGERACPSKYPDYSHGQGVAGTMGGAYGVAPGARLISIDVQFAVQVGDVPNEKRSALVLGLKWVLAHYKEYKIAAVSVSVGDKASRANTVCGIASPIGLYEVVKKLSEADVAVIFSTANAATINWVREPNCLPGVIAVASVASEDPRRIADYSSISPDIDLLAPADFMSAGMNGKDAVFGGTSQAAPFAAGLFALGKEARPDANIAQIFYFIKQSAAPVSDVFVKRIPVVLPAEMVKALQNAKTLPPIKLVKQIQIKSGR